MKKQSNPMSKAQVLKVLRGVKAATVPGKTADGTRCHVWYRTMPGYIPTVEAIAETAPAQALGLGLDRYTGRIDRVFETKAGDTCVCMLVELERDHKYRTFNVDRGDLKAIAVLGN